MKNAEVEIKLGVESHRGLIVDRIRQSQMVEVTEIGLEKLGKSYPGFQMFGFEFNGTTKELGEGGRRIEIPERFSCKILIPVQPRSGRSFQGCSRRNRKTAPIGLKFS